MYVYVHVDRLLAYFVNVIKVCRTETSKKIPYSFVYLDRQNEGSEEEQFRQEVN